MVRGPRSVRVALLVSLAILPSVASTDPVAAQWEPPLKDGAIALYGCRSHYGTLPIPRLVAFQALPEGFRYRPFQVMSGEFAQFGIFVQRCATAVLPDGSVHEDYVEAWHMIPVIPPAGYPKSDWDVFVTGYMTNIPAAAALFEAWNLDTEADGVVWLEQRQGVELPGPSVAAAAGLSFSMQSSAVGLGMTATARYPFLIRAYTQEASGEIERGMDILIGEGLQSFGAIHVTMPHGALFEAPYEGSGFAIVYDWPHTVRTQTMEPVALGPSA